MHTLRIIAMWLKKIRGCMLVLMAMVNIFSSSAYAEERQYKIEAAFLYSFFNYITWPGYSAPQELAKPVICVYGNDPIVPYLNYIRGKMATERLLTVRVLGNIENAGGCHILFMRHRIESDRSNDLANDTLTVVKLDDPLDRGGMIELSEDGERIAIKINQPSLEKNGFQISSRLLDLVQRGK
jgi:hypothetical protein